MWVYFLYFFLSILYDMLKELLRLGIKYIFVFLDLFCYLLIMNIVIF